MTDILVLVERSEAGISRNSLEVLGAARRLADCLERKVGAVVLEEAPSGLSEAVGAYGADTVLAVRHPLLAGRPPEICLAALQQVLMQKKSEVLLLADDDGGRELAPRLAHSLDGAVVTEVVGLEAEGTNLTFRRQLYGGRCLGSFAPQRRPVIVTVKLRSQAPAAECPGRPVPVEDVSVSLDPSLIRAKVVERVAEDVRGVKLEKRAGRREWRPEASRARTLSSLDALAQLLNGAMGASRAATDAGWVRYLGRSARQGRR